jgi:hypothetical protein
VAVDAAGGVPAGFAALVLAAADGVCPAGPELTLLLHPASVKAKIVIAAIARRRLEEAFMGGSSPAKVPRTGERRCGTFVLVGQGL